MNHAAFSRRSYRGKSLKTTPLSQIVYFGGREIPSPTHLSKGNIYVAPKKEKHLSRVLSPLPPQDCSTEEQTSSPRFGAQTHELSTGRSPSLKHLSTTEIKSCGTKSPLSALPRRRETIGVPELPIFFLPQPIAALSRVRPRRAGRASLAFTFPSLLSPRHTGWTGGSTSAPAPSRCPPAPAPGRNWCCPPC